MRNQADMHLLNRLELGQAELWSDIIPDYFHRHIALYFARLTADYVRY